MADETNATPADSGKVVSDILNSLPTEFKVMAVLLLQINETLQKIHGDITGGQGKTAA